MADDADQLVTEIRRGQDSLRVDIAKSIDTQTAAITELTTALREISKMHGAFVAGVLLLALVSVLGLLATRGVDPGAVTHAASGLMGSASASEHPEPKQPLVLDPPPPAVTTPTPRPIEAP